MLSSNSSLGNESNLSSKEENKSETRPSKDNNGNEKEPNQVVPVQSDATISPVSVNMLATTITPFSIFVKVTVSSPSLVWCGVKDSSTSQASTSYLRSYGSAVTDAKTFVIARLQPNTNYPLLCVTIPIDSTNEEDVHSRTQNMMTGDAIFQLTGIRRTRRQVTFHISSNVDATYVCYLMTRKRDYGSIILS